MPVQGGPGGPLGYASSRARQAGTTGASTTSPLQELQDKPPRIVTSLRDDRDPEASLDMPSSRDALPSHDAPSLRPTLLPEPPLAPAKTPIFASTALRVVVWAAGGALGFLWVTPANRQAGEEAALASLRETPRPAAQNVAAERAPDPSAAEQAAAAGAALYQDFLKWRQLRGR